LYYVLKDELKASPFFSDINFGNITNDPSSTNTFTFPATLELKRPLKL